MREILFRVKRLDNGEWIYGSLYHSTLYDLDEIDDYHIIPTFDFYGEDTPLTQLVNETFGQYTGLTDKNGTEIFEGDIVIIKGDDEEPYTVDFDECCFQVYGNGVCFNMNNFYDHDLEVIGNIYDNPELLK